MNQSILIGLGNPGPKYQWSRHNVGFLFLDLLQPDQNQWLNRTHPPYQYSELLVANQLAGYNQLLLCKPQTFMNQSGKVALKLKKTYSQLSLNNWFVIHDDLDLALGTFKIKKESGPKAHNGLISIYNALGSRQFWHVRIGIDNRRGKRQQSGVDYVLQNFSQEEKKILLSVLNQTKLELSNRW